MPILCQDILRVISLILIIIWIGIYIICYITYSDKQKIHNFQMQ